jgi:hypothetical protein
VEKKPENGPSHGNTIVTPPATSDWTFSGVFSWICVVYIALYCLVFWANVQVERNQRENV